jgi:hypothetical protein
LLLRSPPQVGRGNPLIRHCEASADAAAIHALDCFGFCPRNDGINGLLRPATLTLAAKGTSSQ